MTAIERVAGLLACCGNSEAVLPPTELFNEGWMLRLVLDWAARHRSSIEALQFHDGSVWFSEALLASRFRPRKRHDPGGEGFTHADGVIGHFRLRPGGRGDIELLNGARQLTVIEAKMASVLSVGTKYAPEFNQAARNVACIANLASAAAIEISDLPRLSFALVAPAARISEGIFTAALDKPAMRETVAQRARDYDRDASEWVERYFDPVLEHCAIRSVAWESILSDIAAADLASGELLKEFYQQCLRYNPLRPVVAGV